MLWREHGDDDDDDDLELFSNEKSELYTTRVGVIVKLVVMFVESRGFGKVSAEATTQPCTDSAGQMV